MAAILLLAWLLRISCLKRWSILGLNLVCLSVLGGWLISQNTHFAHIQHENPRTVTTQLTVQPDQISVNGGQYQLIADSRYGRVISYGRLANANEQRQLQQLDRRTIWQVQGEVSPVPPPTNPGQFNAPNYYRSHGIYRQLTIADVRQVRLAPRTGWWQGPDLLHHWRKQFMIASERLPKTLQLYATSLLIGSRPATFRTTMTGVQQLGLLYLFSLSGMHVILLIGLLRWGLIRCHLSRPTIDGWLLVLLPSYLILGGGADSLKRAVVTVMLSLAWQLVTGQRQHALAGWSVALLLGIWQNPLVLLQLGGQLSYGLALLLILLPRLSVWRLSGWIQLLSLPVILLATSQWHLLTIAVSVLVAPIFTWILLPLTLLGASVGFWSANIAAWCDWGLNGFQAIINWVGTLPGLLTIGRPPTWLAWVIALMTLWLLRHPTRRLAVKLVLVYAGMVFSIHWPWRGAVQFIDIGQGDSILIRQPFNRSVSLIDTGGRLQFPRPKWQQGTRPRARVETVTVNYLHQLGISQIDTVYLSHKDVDHMGDLGQLLQLIRVRQIVVPAGMAALPKFRQLLHPAIGQPIVREALAGQQFADGLTAVHPFQPGKAENEDSLVLTGQFGGQRFMFTGDLDRAGERAIVARYPALRVDVLKLGHHGSKTASDPQALQQLGVQRGILSVGRHNRYGHPNAETLTTLAQQHILTYSTACQGMITYHFGGGQASHWETFLKEGNFYQRTASH
ncbi:DNA internalization-related competence protein ComEC/Rec2 [Lactiplantibacillus sp. WILCCON 0030]|uniref:DNA internalization-related competence protein ComEC/Rec2 n=1 Tax=Lactiplantibacillus brownii TaxID=3069269 RepID=A0ABU1A9D2_9LACO|nr:DNA internalization-related competence protein ComEC/Rec2 [Lactiplantibacillus brownii]MDQ7937577.1 DNA internalization-related competence protein ComEC/Rec2 [Lactiplantibacillus brownii]